MTSSLFPSLVVVVLLAFWHAILVRYQGEPGWARTLVRAGLLLTTLAQALGFVLVQSLTHEVPVDRIPQVLGQVSMIQAWVDGTSVVAMLVVAGVLATFTIRRWLSRRAETTEEPTG